jgi:nitrogen-specific signal transduction histidine kinase/ActR/RegA family two-component response regulator
MITPEYLKELSDEELLRYAARIEVVVSLAGDVAHEFNDILQALKGYTELAMIDTKETNKIYPALDSMHKIIQSGSDLTKRLLTLGKPFEREPERRKYVRNISREVEKVKKTIERMIPDRIDLTLDLHDTLQPVCIDPYHVEQIINSLCLNSIESISNKGLITIKTGDVYLDDAFCSSHKTVTPGDYVFISVEDNGKGIPTNIEKHVFDPFFSTKSKKAKGTMLAVGLGLTVVDRIAKMYKGTVTIESKENIKTRVIVYIPAVKEINNIPTTVAKGDTVLKIGKEKILVIDDNDFVRGATVLMLEKFGYNVTGAWAALEGLKLYKSNKLIPNLALVDLVMPKISGKQFLIMVKELNKNNKVIIISGYDLNYSQRKELYALGASAIMAKPYTTKKLLETVRKVLDE